MIYAQTQNLVAFILPSIFFPLSAARKLRSFFRIFYYSASLSESMCVAQNNEHDAAQVNADRVRVVYNVLPYQRNM